MNYRCLIIVLLFGYREIPLDFRLLSVLCVGIFDSYQFINLSRNCQWIMKTVPWYTSWYTPSYWPLKSWTSPFTFPFKRYVVLEKVLCFACELSRSASSIYLEKLFFLLWLSSVMHSLLLESNPGKHLLFLHSGTALRLPWALLSREGNRESCQKAREWEFETEWDSEQAFIYATIFNPTPSRLSQGFLSRTLRKQAWLGFLPARGLLRANQGRIVLWWPGTDSKGKRVKIMPHICVIRFHWSKWLSEREFDM